MDTNIKKDIIIIKTLNTFQYIVNKMNDNIESVNTWIWEDTMDKALYNIYSLQDSKLAQQFEQVYTEIKESRLRRLEKLEINRKTLERIYNGNYTF